MMQPAGECRSCLRPLSRQLFHLLFCCGEQVASPMELETIDERNLANALREEDSEEDDLVCSLGLVIFCANYR